MPISSLKLTACPLENGGLVTCCQTKQKIRFELKPKVYILRLLMSHMQTSNAACDLLLVISHLKHHAVLSPPNFEKNMPQPGILLKAQVFFRDGRNIQARIPKPKVFFFVGRSSLSNNSKVSSAVLHSRLNWSFGNVMLAC